MKSTGAGKVAYLGMFVALAFIFSYVEAVLPFSIAVPGIKLGLANIVVITALYAFGIKEAFAISAVRIVLVAFTFSNTFTMIYSLAGGMLSWALMGIFKKSNRFSIIGVSVIGGVFHNIGQLIIAAILMETVSLVYYLPILMIGGTATGIVIGILGKSILKILKTNSI
ncbi:MAG: Gx transporter family protein [Clostridiales bacterium]|jgi:heptaprenyl diphosphate synthase|nr:Gx transporter family protein [Clostridiales bacterium]